MNSTQFSNFVSSNIQPVIDSVISVSTTLFGNMAFASLFIAVLGLSVAGLVLGLIKR